MSRLYRSLEVSREQSFYATMKSEHPRAKVLKLEVQGQAGFPDRLVLMPGGVSLLVEFKRDGEALRKLQEHRRNELAELGHTVVVVDSALSLTHLEGLLRRLR